MLVLVCLLTSTGLIAISFGEGVYRIFPHSKHPETQFECTTCHSDVETSVGVVDNNLPTTEKCEMCHNPVPEVEAWSPTDMGLNFSHERHLNKDFDCATCHHPAPGKTETKVVMPRMATCISCHRKEKQTERCLDCHIELGTPDLVPISHTRQWSWAHGDQARQEEEFCANCHNQSFCQDCHHGDNIEPKPHRRNRSYTHSISARKGLLECIDCHDAPNESECVACHKSQMGEPSSHRKSAWIRKHQTEGEMNLSACATCHYDMGEDALCTRCHKE